MLICFVVGVHRVQSVGINWSGGLLLRKTASEHDGRDPMSETVAMRIHTKNPPSVQIQDHRAIMQETMHEDSQLEA